MKKIFLLTMIIILFAGSLSSYAYEFPTEFWGISDNYEKALDANDNDGIIKYGLETLSLLAGEPDCAETRTVKAARYQKMAFAFHEKGDYENALTYFEKLNKISRVIGEDFTYWIEPSEKAIAQLTPEIVMYTDGGDPLFYDAKNEKENGVLFGLCSDGPIRNALKNESMTLVYQELGEDLFDYNRGMLKNAANAGIAVEFALNCPNEGDDIRDIKSFDKFIKKLCNLFNEFDNVPIYLRFAAEFDVWTNTVDAQSFKEAFIYVSELVKSKTSHVAMVWSPNQVSALNTNTDDYYPGDAYVDWVGVSSYAVMYHMGNKNQTEWDSLLFKSGKNATPVLALRDIVEKYGDRKPIMLSESGASHNVNGEDTTDFALKMLREYYCYLPMVYPQIKLIAHFDNYVKGEANDFSLFKNPKVKKEYLALTKGARFIQSRYDNQSDVCYRPIEGLTAVNDSFLVSCYVHIYDDDIQNVTYYLDGVEVGKSDKIPFSVILDKLEPGEHTLDATATGHSGRTASTQATIKVTKSSADNTATPSPLITEYENQQQADGLKTKLTVCAIAAGILLLIAIIIIVIYRFFIY